MNYIGSKSKLSDFVFSTIQSQVGMDLSQKVFCDLFAGTGAIGKKVKTKVKQVISNDFEYYSYVLNKNYIENHLKLENAEWYINYLNDLPIIETGFIYNNYCLGGGTGRMYFTDENGKKIDSIRHQIKLWKEEEQIDDSTYYFLLASLLESADRVANTASVYGAYLKKFKKSALKELKLTSAEFQINKNQHKVFNEDSSYLIRKIKGDILYLDPPYNKRQYGSNYHLLNTMALGDSFVPKGKTGLREYQRSKYCNKKTALSEFDHLLKNADFKYIFLSYNNEGLMSIEEIESLMSRYGHYSAVNIDYQRFKADNNRKQAATSTKEYIHILEK